MRAYERVVRENLPRPSAEVDHVADGFHLSFASPSEALRTALAIADALAKHNARHPDLHLPIGFGIDAGEPIRRQGRYVGAAPVLASRLASHASGGQVLLSEGVATLLKSAKLGPFRDLGAWKPPGIGPVRIFQARSPDLPSDVDERETTLAAVLHTDIEGHTARAAALGDRAWREVLERHHAIVREALRRHGGIEHDTAGDGFYTTFPTPSQAISCAIEIRDRVHRELGISVRAGVHVGECEVAAGKIGGLSVTIGARVRDRAAGGEIFVSQTARDALMGRGFHFAERGSTALKGVPGDWAIYAVEAKPSEA